MLEKVYQSEKNCFIKQAVVTRGARLVDEVFYGHMKAQVNLSFQRDQNPSITSMKRAHI